MSMKNTSLKSFIQFSKMVSSNFQSTFFLFRHKNRRIVINKKEKTLCKKNVDHTASISGNCMISFLCRQQLYVLSNFEIASKKIFFFNRKFFFHRNFLFNRFFSNRKSNFVLNLNFQKKSFACKITFCVCITNIVLDTKVRCFQYMNCVRKLLHNSGHFQCIVNFR